MDSKSLIIDIRRKLAWQQRLPSELSTAAVWGGWLSLWQPVLSRLLGLRYWPYLKSTLSAKLFLIGLASAWALGGAMMILMAIIIWRMVLGRLGKISHPEINPITKLCLLDCSRHFQISETQLFRAQNSKICYIYHNHCGRITCIVPAIPMPEREKNANSARL